MLHVAQDAATARLIHFLLLFAAGTFLTNHLISGVQSTWAGPLGSISPACWVPI